MGNVRECQRYPTVRKWASSFFFKGRWRMDRIHEFSIVPKTSKDLSPIIKQSLLIQSKPGNSQTSSFCSDHLPRLRSPTNTQDYFLPSIFYPPKACQTLRANPSWAGLSRDKKQGSQADSRCTHLAQALHILICQSHIPASQVSWEGTREEWAKYLRAKVT